MTTLTITGTESAVQSSTVPVFDDPERWQPESPPTMSLPHELLNRYIDMAMRPAVPVRSERETWFCDLPKFPGVWAEGESVKACLDTLQEVVREWLILKIADGDLDIPVLDEIDLTILSQQYR